MMKTAKMTELKIEDEFSHIHSEDHMQNLALEWELKYDQPTLNIGTIGHVAHGKTTLLKGLTGVDLMKFKSEKKENKTIKLGYANAKIYKAMDPNIPRPECFISMPSKTPNVFTDQSTGITYKLIRHVSFVDCPGHESYMAAMLSGASVMDAAFLLISSNESCPQPQTLEHLRAIEIMNLKHILVLQNKIDLIKPNEAALQYEHIRNFIKNSVAQGSPILPISAQLKYNMDVICEYITKIPTPIRNLNDKPYLNILRSFDINKPGCENIQQLKGGVVGGSLVRGVLKIGQEIEIRPGICERNEAGEWDCYRPIVTKILSLNTEQNELSQAIPGGLIGIGTNMDPCLAKGDNLIGNVLGLIHTLPDVYAQFEFNYILLPNLIETNYGKNKNKNKNMKQFETSLDDNTIITSNVKPLKKYEYLRVNVGSNSTDSQIIATKKDLARVILKVPLCVEIGSKLAISRKINKKWRLIGWGTVLKGIPLKQKSHKKESQTTQIISENVITAKD